MRNERLRRFRWQLADQLSRLACWLRGHAWYSPNNMSGVPGNRAADLKQSIWERCVVLSNSPTDDADTLGTIDKDLTELGQLAGEQWGHIWPKKI